MRRCPSTNSLHISLTSTQGEFATSEQTIISSPDLCDTSSPNVDGQLRADYTNCGLPNDALTANCIHGYQNEGADCGFQYNLQGLCTFCGASSINATDSCCVTSNVESRCRNVQLPRYTSMQPFTTNLPSATPTPTPGSNSSSGGGSGLSGGQIAGIVVGSVVGAILLLALLICCCIAVRRRRQNRSSMSSLNQPTPPRSGASGGMSQMGKPPPFEALPGARVTRMTALEGFQDGSPGQGDSSGFDTSPESQAGMAGAAAAVPVRKGNNDGVDDSSPDSGDFSSPDGNGQSERMSSFKDYYSQDEIHSGDHVAVLWAYQPRAPDEFELERGDMVKIVGIWDDGWATGVRVSHRAEDWSPSRTTGHDSVVSNESARGGSADSEIKAFPVSFRTTFDCSFSTFFRMTDGLQLVCVCLPQHWRRTIEGEPSSPPSERDQ